MGKQNVSASISLGTIGLITFIVFLCLKLNHVWEISWFWVWFPLWIPWAVYGVIILITIVVLIIAAKSE